MHDGFEGKGSGFLGGGSEPMGFLAEGGALLDVYPEIALSCPSLEAGHRVVEREGDDRWIRRTPKT